MQKPVWRLNTGKGVPSDYNGGAVSPSPVAYYYGLSTLLHWDYVWSTSRCMKIYAYQTNRTKPVKFRK